MIPFDIGWNEIAFYCDEFADSQIRSNTKYDTIVGIGRGGLVPAVIVSHSLGVPLVPVMWQKRDGNTQYEQVLREYVKGLSSDIENRILIVDDINDTGVTMLEVGNSLKNFLQVYEKPAIVKTFTVYQKPSTKHPSDFFMEELDDDEWAIFPWENGEQ